MGNSKTLWVPSSWIEQFCAGVLKTPAWLPISWTGQDNIYLALSQLLTFLWIITLSHLGRLILDVIWFIICSTWFQLLKVWLETWILWMNTQKIVLHFGIKATRKSYEKTYKKIAARHSQISCYLLYCTLWTMSRKAQRTQNKGKSYCKRFKLTGPSGFSWFTSDEGWQLSLYHALCRISKFHFLRPMKSKTALEVAHELLLICLVFGAPHVTTGVSLPHK